MKETRIENDGVQSETRPLLIWDGDCDFCRYWVMRWRAKTGDHIRYVPSREIANCLPHISKDTLERSVVLALPDKSYRTGAHAVLTVMATDRNAGWPLWLYDHIPPVRLVCEATYRLIARNRGVFYRLTLLLWGN